MKRFVIHIYGSDRHKRMISEMVSVYGPDFEAFPAIVKDKAYEGISESFKAVIKQNYEEPMIHILEDDVRFLGKDAMVKFEEGFNNLPSDWSIYLGGSYTHKVEEDLGGLLRVSDYRSFHSVIVRKSAYDAFLSHDTKVIHNIDTHVSSIVKNAYLCNPQVAIQYNGYSYNRGKEVNYDNFLKNKNLNEVKSIL